MLWLLEAEESETLRWLDLTWAMNFAAAANFWFEVEVEVVVVVVVVLVKTMPEKEKRKNLRLEKRGINEKLF